MLWVRQKKKSARCCWGGLDEVVRGGIGTAALSKPQTQPPIETLKWASIKEGQQRKPRNL